MRKLNMLFFAVVGVLMSAMPVLFAQAPAAADHAARQWRRSQGDCCGRQVSPSRWLAERSANRELARPLVKALLVIRALLPRSRR